MDIPPVEPYKTSEPALAEAETACLPPGADGSDAELGFLQPPGRPDSRGRLGHYEVLQVLGRGGFGIVLRAFDEVLQRVVAIKVLSPSMAATSPARKRFLREARAAAQVRHVNVVQIYAVEEQPFPYLVMEFIPGETLQDRLNRTGPLSAAEVADVGRQIAEGLAAAHAVGLIHRDIKPGNILIEPVPPPHPQPLTPEGKGVEASGGEGRKVKERLRVKITDFGLARTADDASLTQSGAVLGTPLYMSPEQAAGTKLDHRSDLFSLGSVLYAITAGRPPFRAETTLAIMRRVAEDTPRPIPEVIPETPAWLCRLIARLMAKNPDKRLQSAAEVAAALEAGEAAVPPPTGLRARRLAWPAALAALLAAAAIGIGLWAAGFFDNAAGPDRSQLAGDPQTPAHKPPLNRPNPTTTDPKTTKPAAPSTSPQDSRPAKDGFRFTEPGTPGLPAISEDGKLLAAPWGDKLWLFQTPSGKRLNTLPGSGGQVRKAALSSTGRLLAAVSGAPQPLTLRVWDLDTLGPLYTHNLAFGAGPLTFNPDGSQLVVCPDVDSGKYLVLNARTGEQVKSLPGGKRGVARFNPEGTLLAACDYDDGGPSPGRVSVWNAKTWQLIKTLKPPRGWARDLRFSPDGTLLAVADSEAIELWETKSFSPTGGFDLTCYWSFDFSPDGKSILVKCTDDSQERHALKYWDLKSHLPGREIGISYPNKSYLSHAVSPDGTTIYVPCLASQRVRVFDAASGSELLP